MEYCLEFSIILAVFANICQLNTSEISDGCKEQYDSDYYQVCENEDCPLNCNYITKVGNPLNCSTYYLCDKNENKLKLETCEANLKYDIILKNCIEANARCEKPCITHSTYKDYVINDEILDAKESILSNCSLQTTKIGKRLFYDPCDTNNGKECIFFCPSALKNSDQTIRMANPEDCYSFYVCSSDGFKSENCPGVTHFDIESHNCNNKKEDKQNCKKMCQENFYKKYVYPKMNSTLFTPAKTNNGTVLTTMLSLTRSSSSTATNIYTPFLALNTTYILTTSTSATVTSIKAPIDSITSQKSTYSLSRSTSNLTMESTNFTITTIPTTATTAAAIINSSLVSFNSNSTALQTTDEYNFTTSSRALTSNTDANLNVSMTTYEYFTTTTFGQTELTTNILTTDATTTILNCDMCPSKKYSEILDQLNKILQHDQTNFVQVDDELMTSISAELAAVTKSSSSPNAGDLNSALDSLATFALIRSDEKQNANIDREEIKNVFQTVSNVLDGNFKNAWETLKANNSSVGSKVLSTGDKYGELMAHKLWNITKKDETKLANLVIQLQPIKFNSTFMILYPTASDESSFPPTFVKLPSDLLEKNTRLNLSLSYSCFYKNMESNMPTNKNDSLGSRISSFTLYGIPKNAVLKNNITLYFSHTEKEKFKDFSRKCAFWDFNLNESGGGWSSEGCTVLESNISHTACSCNHFTNFAILMNPFKDNLVDNLIISLISMIGCIISIVLLVLTIIVHIVSWKSLEVRHHHAVLINLCICLIIANSLFIGGIDKTSNRDVCFAIAVLLHYFYLAAFFLMLADGIRILIYVAFSYHVPTKRESTLLIIIAWFVPMIIVGISIAITKREGYGNASWCWLSIENGLIWAFVGPAMTIIAINIIFLIIIQVNIFKSRNKIREIKPLENIRKAFLNLLVMTPLLGLTWIFGVLSVNKSLIVFQYIFAVANSLQGAFIFILHVACNSKKKKVPTATLR